MDVHQFSSKIRKYKGFDQRKLSVYSSVPGVLGQTSVEQHSQTAKSGGFQISTKKPLLWEPRHFSHKPFSLCFLIPRIR